MAAKKKQFVVARKTNDPSFVRLFGSAEEAHIYLGPTWEEDGYILDAFEKENQTVYRQVKLD